MDSKSYKPEIFLTGKRQDIAALNNLLNAKNKPQIIDQFLSQQRELIKINSPKHQLDDQQILSKQTEINANKEVSELGCWIFYPWKNTLVHIVDPQDYIRIRTARNQFKITPEEQESLGKRKVGIIGLSVGHSVAINLAMERSVGELRLADFDSLELSNINRIKTSILNIGLPKIIIAAREIAEIDPFIKVKCYSEGITEDNLDDFLTEGGTLDALVEECDSLNIKILARKKAKEFKIPVLMETSDRGMLDVERFDLEHNRPILHGFIDHLDLDVVKNLKTSEEKIPYLMPMVGIDTMSTRLKASALEVGESIGTWPQLSTSVMLGGAVLCDTYRKIMLGEKIDSGRYIVDPSDIIGKENNELPESLGERGQQKCLDLLEMKRIIDSLNLKERESLPEKIQNLIVEAAGKAPSGGNSQPWKYYSSKGYLHLFFDACRSDSFMDYRHTASYIALGASLENAIIKAASLGYKTVIHNLPLGEKSSLMASMSFDKESIQNENLAAQIDLRYTDRRMGNNERISENELQILRNICDEFKELETEFINDREKINEIAQVVSSGDWLRIMNYDSHRDFIIEEMRWNKEDLIEKRDGIFVEELSLSPSDLAGLHLIKDREVIKFMNERKSGHGLKNISSKLVNSAEYLLYAFAKNDDKNTFLQAGRLMERLWLNCTEMNIGFQILNVPIAFLLRSKNNDVEGISPYFVEEIDRMSNKLSGMFENYNERSDLFIVRLFKGKNAQPTSYRRKLKDFFTIE